MCDTQPSDKQDDGEEENIFKMAQTDPNDQEDLKIDILDILEVYVPQTTLEFARKRQIGSLSRSNLRKLWSEE